MIIFERFRDIFYSTEPLEERDYVSSRNMSILEGCTARTVFNLTSGAFLAGYARFLGADDAFNGIIGALPVLAGVIQLFSPIYFERLEKRKLQIAILNFLHRFILGLMVFIPLIAFDRTPRLLLLSAIYFIAYLAVSFASPAASGLLIDLTPANIRGRFFGRRESFLIAVGTVFALVLSSVMDNFKAGGNEYGGFIVTFSVILLFSFADLFFWSRIKEPDIKRKSTTLRVKQIITMPLKNAGFMKIVGFFVIYNIGLLIGGPFFSVYMVTGLKLNYTFIILMSMISTIANVTVVRIWGKVADSRSWDFVLKYSILLLGITHFIWMFVNNSTALLLVPVLHMAGGAAWAGIGISTFNIQFIYSPEEGRTIYIGFNAAVGGIIGFLGTFAGSLLLMMFERMGLHILNFKIGGMQMLFSISGILLALSSVYVHFFIKQPVTQE